MHHKRFDEIVNRRLETCQDVLTAKGEQYSREGDRLWNFKRAGSKLGCHPAKALQGMAIKHAVSVDDMIDDLAFGEIPDRCKVVEKIGDAINYLLLLEGLIEEERDKAEGRNPDIEALAAELYAHEVRIETDIADLEEVSSQSSNLKAHGISRKTATSTSAGDRMRKPEGIQIALPGTRIGRSEGEVGDAGQGQPDRPLDRYGLRWNGPTNFVCTEMSDGYWTPWHLAEAEMERLRHEIDAQSYWGPKWEEAYNEVQRLKRILATHGITA